MPATTRRSILAAAAGLASLGSVRAMATSVAAPSVSDDEIARLVRLSRESNAALMRGDVDRYRGLIALTDDFTLMSPFGSLTKGAASISDEQWEGMKRFFRNGTFELELVQAYASSDLAVLALIERSHVEIGNLPPQDWALRVTLVYRREGSEWRLAHRHADPIVAAITLDQSAALARGAHGPGGFADRLQPPG